MSRPTLWQSLLGKPSQSYSFPSDKNYFSSKQDMLRIAAELQPSSLHPTTLPVPTEPKDNDSNDDEFKTLASTIRRYNQLYDEEDEGNMSDSEDDVFYTPNTSPRMSMASSRSGGSSAYAGRRTPGPSQRSSRTTMNKAHISASAGASSVSDPSVAVANKTSRRAPAAITKETEPRARGQMNPGPTASTTAKKREQQQLQQTRLLRHPVNANKGHTSTSSLSSASLDGHSLFSLPMSDSTRTSSPPHFESGARSVNSAHSPAYPDEDREKGALGSPPDDQAFSKSSKKKPFASPPVMTHTRSNGGTNYAPPRKQNNALKSTAKTNPSIMANMSALLEEDEDATLRPYNSGSHPQSNVITMQPEDSRTSSKLTSTLDDSTRPTSRRTSTTSMARRTNNSASSKSHDAVTNGGDSNSGYRTPNLRHRRSRSHEDLRTYSRSDSRSHVIRTSVTALSSLPMPTGDLPSHGTPGYTSLVLPRAPPPTSLNPRAQIPKIEPNVDGKIDLTRSGIAQTTIATVEVVHGLGASAKSGKGLLAVLGKGVGLGRRRTVSGRVGSDATRARRSEDNAIAGGRTIGVHRPLGFTNYRKPPDYVASSSVLVQVWAVGVDGVDARLVGLKLGSGQKIHKSFSPKANAANGHARTESQRWKFVRSAVAADQDQHQLQLGYIPGRSFVGRVLERGWEVADDVVRKGDWVVGLLDVRKAGALSEFIIADKRRIYRVPQPKMNELSLKALGKQPERRSSTTRSPAWGLTLEELALLPLCGVPAYRAVRTFVYAFSSSPTTEVEGMFSGSARIMSSPQGPQLDEGPVRRRRALVLRGHDGAGAMATRMLIAKGWDVSIHVPCIYPTESHQAETYMSDIEDRARTWGCDEVIFDDGLEENGDEGRGAVVRILERLWAEGDVVDAVLDTVGGKEIWEAAERLLKSAGSNPPVANSLSPGKGSARLVSKKSPKALAQFTTLVGDSPSRVVPSAGDLFKAGVRSLRLGGRPSVRGNAKHEDGPNALRRGGSRSGEKKVGYAWVSAAQDVDWEGQNVSESIATVLRVAIEGFAKPLVGSPSQDHRVVAFENAPDVFVDEGPLSHGVTAVVKIAG